MQASKRRDWVKNAAIAFLAVLLVLTYFSNTILNYSLPEVSTQYIGSGTITARIRGTGNVTANETYEVRLNQTRRVDSIGIKPGSVVAKGDILFVLSAGESSELEQARTTLRDLQFQLQRAQLNITPANYDKENAEIQRAREDLQILVTLQDANAVLEWELENAQKRVKEAEEKVKYYEDMVESNVMRRKFFEQELGYPYLPPEYADADEWLADAQKELADAKKELSELELKEVDLESYTDRVRTAQRRLEDLILALAQLQASDQRAAALDGLETNKLRAQITDQERLIASLEGETSGTEILSPVAGIVRVVNVNTGKETELNTPLATIDVLERGYSLNFTVTLEQSQRVRVGDKAETSGYYWGPPIDATLENIRIDPENPSQSRILTFGLKGESLESGIQLSLSVGQRSTQYNTVIPNSALRQDSNGQYVLIIVARSTALGNRYIATRVDIARVLATDDTNTAVEAGLSNWDYVITSSSSPIEPGMQVRMAQDM